MLHGREFIFHFAGDALGPVHGPVGLIRNIDFARLPAAAGYSGLTLQQVFGGSHEGGQGDTHPGQQLRNESGFIGQQSAQQVDGFDLRGTVFLGQALGGADGFGGFLSQLFRV